MILDQKVDLSQLIEMSYPLKSVVYTTIHVASLDARNSVLTTCLHIK